MNSVVYRRIIRASPREELACQVIGKPCETALTSIATTRKIAREHCYSGLGDA